MNFKEWLVCELAQVTPKIDMYYDPDNWYKRESAVPFIYRGASTKMLYGHNMKTAHYDILTDFNIYSEYEQYTKEKGVSDFYQIADAMGDLFGRIGMSQYSKSQIPFDGRVCAFWNMKPDVYFKYLEPCVKRLMQDDKLGENDMISTPNHKTFPVADLVGIKSSELSDEERERIELHQKLHLMRGAEKIAAMKKLGVGGGGTPHKMQRALDNAGLRTPGQKWQTPHSENAL